MNSSPNSTGAEKAFLPEQEIYLADLEQDVAGLIEGFKRGKRLGLMIRTEKAGESEFTSPPPDRTRIPAP